LTNHPLPLKKENGKDLRLDETTKPIYIKKDPVKSNKMLQIVCFPPVVNWGNVQSGGRFKLCVF
jgi:hypothetical protein